MCFDRHFSAEAIQLQQAKFGLYGLGSIKKPPLFSKCLSRIRTKVQIYRQGLSNFAQLVLYMVREKDFFRTFLVRDVAFFGPATGYTISGEKLMREY